MDLKNILVDKCELKDMKMVSLIHKELFKDHLLGMLPISLLQEFYTSFLNDENIFLVAEYNNRVLGFVLGGYGKKLMEAKSSFLKKNFLRFGFNILIRKNALKLFLNTYCKRKDDKKENVTVAPYRLLSIGVLPQYQGKGIAQQLTKCFEEELRMKYMGQKPINYGLSVHNNNTKAIRFYYKEGFTEDFHSDMSMFMHKII